MPYARIPYPSNTFTPWGKPNWSYMPAMGGYLYILRGVPEDHLMEVLPLGGLMVLEGLVDFLLMVLMVLLVLGGMVPSLLIVLEGLVALLLVVLEALEVYLLEFWMLFFQHLS